VKELARTALIGVGDFGRILLAKLSRTSHLVAAYNPSARETAVQACDSAGVPLVHALDELPAHLDWVVIATPVGTHAELTERFLREGRSVYCQKPLCPTSSEASSLFQLADEFGGALFVDEVFLHRDGFAQLASHLKDRSIERAEFSWTKDGPHRDPLPQALTYHDLYLADALGVSLGNYQVQTDGPGVLEIIQKEPPVRFFYDRNVAGPARKRVELLLQDGTTVRWDNRQVFFSEEAEPYTESADALETQMRRLFGGEIDTTAAGERALRATRQMEAIAEVSSL